MDPGKDANYSLERTLSVFSTSFGNQTYYPDVPRVEGALELVICETEREQAYRSLVCKRTDALFRPTVVHDPLARTKGNAHFFPGYFHGALLVGPFQLHPNRFLDEARRNAPHSPEASVSAFAGWVYSLYGTAGSKPEDLEKGLAAERKIFQLGTPDPRRGARKILSSCDNTALSRSPAGWRQVHCGLHLDPEKNEIPFSSIRALTVRGEPLRASPDLIYKNARTGAIVIVEIKLTLMSIPSNLWPNIWAQLWCYAQLPVATQAPQVTVVGEVWGEVYKWSRLSRANLQWLALRAMVHRDPRAPSYDRFFRQLFDIYRGYA